MSFEMRNYYKFLVGYIVLVGQVGHLKDTFCDLVLTIKCSFLKFKVLNYILVHSFVYSLTHFLPFLHRQVRWVQETSVCRA